MSHPTETRLQVIRSAIAHYGLIPVDLPCETLAGLERLLLQSELDPFNPEHLLAAVERCKQDLAYCGGNTDEVLAHYEKRTKERDSRASLLWERWKYIADLIRSSQASGAWPLVAQLATQPSSQRKLPPSEELALQIRDVLACLRSFTSAFPRSLALQYEPGKRHDLDWLLKAGIERLDEAMTTPARYAADAKWWEFAALFRLGMDEEFCVALERRCQRAEVNREAGHQPSSRS